MKVQCPQCGKQIVVGRLGRKPLNHSVIEVCDALQESNTVKQVAEIVGVSRTYIYKILGANGLKPRDYLTKGVHSVKYKRAPTFDTGFLGKLKND